MRVGGGVILVLAGLLLIYLAATGRAAAFWQVLSQPGQPLVPQGQNQQALTVGVPASSSQPQAAGLVYTIGGSTGSNVSAGYYPELVTA